MFPRDIVIIIAGYAGSDIYDIDVIKCRWPRETFFQMELTCLRKIINHLHITPIQINRLHTYDIQSIDNSRTLSPNIDVLYSLYFENHDTHKHDFQIMNYYLSKFTPLSTADFIEKYPKAVSFGGLCDSDYIDYNYMLNYQYNNIDWFWFTRNPRVPLSILRQYPDKIDQNVYLTRGDVSIDHILQDESITITENLTYNPNIPVDKVIRKYRHRLTHLAFRRLISHPDAPLDYILTHAKDVKDNEKIFNDNTNILTNTINVNQPRVLLFEICEHPKVPFDIIFRDYKSEINWEAICQNPNLPFDFVLNEYSDKINWICICKNPNFPVRLLNDERYIAICLVGGITFNKQLDFSKISNINTFHNRFVEVGNTGYYEYLIKQRLISVLMSI